MRRVILPLALILILTACTPTAQSTPTPVPTDGVSVHTDWSMLGEREDPLPAVGGRWYEEYTDQLIPREDYGMLVPYAGLRLMDDWPANNGCLFGLMTVDGTVVTDPVYSSVYRPAHYGQTVTDIMPLLVLRQGQPGEEAGYSLAKYAVAAWDGSWCTDFEYDFVSTSRKGLILLQEDRMTIMNPDTTIKGTWTVQEMGLTQEEFDSMCGSAIGGEGFGARRLGSYISIASFDEYTQYKCFNLETEKIEILNEDQWWELLQIEESEEPEPETKPVVIPNASLLLDNMAGRDTPGLLQLCEYGDTELVRTYYLEDGTPLPELTRMGHKWYQQISVVGGFIEVLDLNTASYYDLVTMECVFRTYFNYERD